MVVIVLFLQYLVLLDNIKKKIQVYASKDIQTRTEIHKSDDG